MKKILLGILIICILVVSIWGVNKYTSASKTSSEITNNQAASSSTPVSGGNSEITIGSGSGAPDSVITIPISVKTFPEKGIGSFNFNIKYDASILEAVEVKPGELFGGNSSDFDYKITAESGLVSFLFTSSNSAEDLITKPGVITNISFKVKKDAKTGTTKITNDNTGAFGDSALNRIKAAFTEGEIKVN
ncbi:cellulosome-anchoring protein precursor [Ruminiclostridium hungatei]|uniref:Cellulosome-anchoring protein n=1 Tax=Ruminiclostridium hungatei TaxID=48256 RepID=A0A1V4SEV4_RUMHU|nr:cohesin domain-containing protein [Ruminiclostridium hungatei]OPX42273.1 cellulosome-anchoring protein precursor [Ruminiclostridium hungatei]